MDSTSLVASSKIMVPILFTILLAGIIGTQDAFAVTTKTYNGPSNGDWEIANNWSPSGVPEKNDHVVIIGEPFIGILVNINSDVTIGPSGSITFDLDGNLRVNDPNALLTIQGSVVMNGIKDDLFAREGRIVNDVTGSITLGQGQILVQNVGTGGTFTNHGTIEGDLRGGTADHTDFNIVIFDGGLFQNSGTCLFPIKVLTGGTIEGIPCVSGNYNFDAIGEITALKDIIQDILEKKRDADKLIKKLDKVTLALNPIDDTPILIAKLLKDTNDLLDKEKITTDEHNALITAIQTGNAENINAVLAGIDLGGRDLKRLTNTINELNPDLSPDIGQACMELDGFINEVNIFDKRKLTVTEKDALIVDAEAFKTSLECV